MKNFLPTSSAEYWLIYWHRFLLQKKEHWSIWLNTQSQEQTDCIKFLSNKAIVLGKLPEFRLLIPKGNSDRILESYFNPQWMKVLDMNRIE